MSNINFMSRGNASAKTGLPYTVMTSRKGHAIQELVVLVYKMVGMPLDPPNELNL